MVNRVLWLGMKAFYLLIKSIKAKINDVYNPLRGVITTTTTILCYKISFNIKNEIKDRLVWSKEINEVRITFFYHS